MPDIIQLLPDHVANQIAAGEVVQRPSSVVKELLENAIDAQATSIKLIIKDAGRTLIQVIDNGNGMSQTDARLSFERHATSKIKKAEDLFNIHTKGFRGEALASIAAIAHVDLKTKQENEELGTHIKIEGSAITSPNLRQRIVAILGKKTNERLVPINEVTDLVEIQGYVAKPEFAKKKRGEQFFFVNNRFIRNAYLHHAVTNAFENLLASGYHPTYYLYLKVPSKSIDINIHPTKTEIKFDDEKSLYAIIRATIKHSLGQYNVAPILDFERKASFDTPYDFKDKKTSTPKVTVDSNFNPFKSEEQRSIKFPFKRENSAHWESLYTGIEIQNIEVESETITPSLFSQENSGAKTYQIHKKFIVSSIKSGIVYIHQHFAHQRILYEEFLENITVKESMSQQLLFPLEISFNKTDIDQIKEIKEDLESIGFLFENIFEDKIVVVGIPVTISESQIAVIIEQLLEDIKNDIPDTSFSQLDIMAKSLAKSLAIKTGTKLDLKEQEELVNKLFLCKEPSFSPFGKTTFITVNLDEIDKKFNN
jgi:DNA mismatch repair protein MutL